MPNEPTDLTGDIEAAVDKAVKEAPAEAPAAAPAPSTSAPASAAASPPDAPAAGSGSGPAPIDPAATGLPASAASGSEEDPDWLKIPADRRQKIVQSARDKGADEAFQSIGLDRHRVNRDEVRQHVSALMTDVVDYYHRLGATLVQAGKIPAPVAGVAPGPGPAARPATPAAQPTGRRARPEASMQTEDGRAIYDASDIAQLLDWHREELREEFGIARLAERDEKMGAEERVQAASTTAQNVLREAYTWHHFDKYAPKIAERMEADGRTTLWSAYNAELQADLKATADEAKRIADTARRQGRSEALEELSSTPNPATPSPRRGAPASVPANGRARSLDEQLENAVNRAVNEAAGASR